MKLSEFLEKCKKKTKGVSEVITAKQAEISRV